MVTEISMLFFFIRRLFSRAMEKVPNAMTFIDMVSSLGRDFSPKSVQKIERKTRTQIYREKKHLDPLSIELN